MTPKIQNNTGWRVATFSAPHVEIEVHQDLEWIDENGNAQRGYREPKIIMGGRGYSPYDALQILFLLAAALELCQRWANEDHP